jgi:hypothetical protein
MKPNMTRTHRVIYVTLGAAGVLCAVASPGLDPRMAWLIGVLGASGIVSGGVGFCATCWFLKTRGRLLSRTTAR